ncbi:DNA repair protein RadC [Terrimonas rubra]|uniref:DNA repair protein RadC n=1 Tax=Terrimonas rubra TaxID=1035890 RepID=A0ABW6A730_9BACT
MQEQNYPIRKWAKDDRPREKLLDLGAKNLSNSELLAILIHKGTYKKSALDIAQEILRLGKENLQELGKLGVKDLVKIKGIGEAKAVTLLAALELGKRRQATDLLPKEIVNSTAECAKWLQLKLGDLKHEVFAVLYLNRSNKIIRFEIVSEGGITSTVVDPKIILKKALETNAVSIILSHNHPSGNLKPSQSDKNLTERLLEAAGYLDIKLLDHIIVSENGYYSFVEAGLI